jgi:antitoxin component of MazEF toxin-antitoxin module
MGLLVKTRKIGGSIVATIPNDWVKKMQIVPGETLEAELKRPRLDMFGVFKGKKIVFTEADRWNDRE